MLGVLLCHVQLRATALFAKPSRVVPDPKIKPQSPRKELSRFLMRSRCLWIVGCTWLAVNLFIPYVNGILLWYLRNHVEFVTRPFADAPQGSICFLSVLNRQAKKKYKFNIRQNQNWAESRGWKYVEFLEEDHHERLRDSNGSNDKTSIMFLKYHGIEFLFEHEECEFAIYVDSDAVVLPEQAHQQLPLWPEKDVVFGNEVFVFAMHEVESDKAHHGVLNAGFILIRKTDFSRRFVRDVLTHPRCNGCRDKLCFDFSAGYDQGCIEKLLSHEYRDQLHHFGVGRVQAPASRTNLLVYNPGNLLFCHPAGLIKDLYDDPCNLFAKDRLRVRTSSKNRNIGGLLTGSLA